MFDWIASLVDTSGFVPRRECGAWTAEWVALHAGSDILIWLAYLSLPLVLLTAVRHPALRPFRLQIALFATFIFACGTTHLIEAVIFNYPVYRLSGVVKAVTAVVSWATVFALIPAVPKILALLARSPTDAPVPPPEDAPSRTLVYCLAVLTALLAVMIRQLLDPLVRDLHPFTLCLLAVVLVSWYGGFWPGLVTLLVSGVLGSFLFVEPRHSFLSDNLNHVFAVGIFLACGVGVAVLGEVQRTTRLRLSDKVTELRVTAVALAAEKRKTDDALAVLDSLVHNAPYGIAYFDADLRLIRVNDSFARATGLSDTARLGTPLTELLPAFPAELIAEYRAVLDAGATVANRLVHGPAVLWEATAFPVPLGDAPPGLGLIGVDVTDRHLAEARLAESEARFRNLTESMPQVVWVARGDGYREYFNSRWYEYTGLTPSESIGRDGWEVVLHPDDEARGRAAWARAVETGERFEIEYRFRRHNGEHEWFLGRAVPVRDKAGRVIRWLGTCTGIDAQVRAVEAAKESETRFRAMADGIPQLAWMTRPDGHIFWYNQRWYDYTGTTLEEMRGWGWEKVHDPAELPRMLDTWRAALAAGEPWEDTFPLRRHDGQMRWHLSRAVPLRDADGRILLWFGTNTDVTDQRAAAEAVRLSEARFRQLADAMPQIVYESNPAGRVDYVNRRWREYSGSDAAQTDDLPSRVHPDDLGVMTERWEQAMTAGTPLVAEFRLRGEANGTYRWFLTRAVPVRDDDGRITRWYGTSTDIDDQKRQEYDLRESRRFIESVLHSLPSHLAVIEADGRIVTVNAAWQQFGEANGVPAGFDWTATNYLDACRRNAAGQRAAEGIRAVIRGDREAFELEYPCHGNGVERYFVLRANRFRGDGPVRLVVTHENVTERVQAERQVREAASQLQQLTEGMPILMWACRPSGECDYLSRQWMDYTGVAMADHLGLGWLDALHPHDRAGTNEAWAGAVQGRTDFDIEYRLRRRDGEYRWFAVRGIPLRDRDGVIVRWYGCSIDIEDRKQQEATLEKMVTERTAALHRTNAELREQRIFLDAILNNVAEGVVACDADGRLKLFNAATRQMHGLPAEPLPPDRWAEYYHLYEADGVTPMPPDRVPLARAWAGELVRDVEMMIRSDGRPDRYVLCSGVLLRTANGRQFGAVVSMRDMTERREYERQLLVTAAALKVSNESLEKFAYIASHDLQEPLRKIQAFGTRLADKHRAALDDEGKDYIDRMLDSAGRMRKLIEDLLAFSRVTVKAVPSDSVELTAVVRDVLLDLELRIHNCHGRVDVGPLPALPGDASQLRQVFQNLIGNALKFARPDVPPVVRVTAVRFDELPPDADPAPPTGPGWRIEVSDNGIGFEQEYAERIFELFQRLHGRAVFEGTGLGLAIVRKILLRHGASVIARGRPNSGATFIIDWPTPP